MKERKCFFDTAMSCFYERYSKDFRVMGLLVEYKLLNEKYSDASDLLKKMLLLNKKNYKVWEQILYTENIMNNYDSVIKYGSNSIEIFENQPIQYLYTGIANQQTQKIEKAIEVLEKGMKFANDEKLLLQFYIFLAETYHESGKMDVSFDYFEKALLIENENVIIMNNYAYYLAVEERNLERAEKLSKYTIGKEKRNATYLDTYAWILYKMKRMKMAEKYIKKAIKFGGTKSNVIVEHYNAIIKM